MSGGSRNRVRAIERWRSRSVRRDRRPGTPYAELRAGAPRQEHRRSGVRSVSRPGRSASASRLGLVPGARSASVGSGKLGSRSVRRRPDRARRARMAREERDGARRTRWRTKNCGHSRVRRERRAWCSRFESAPAVTIRDDSGQMTVVRRCDQRLGLHPLHDRRLDRRLDRRDSIREVGTPWVVGAPGQSIVLLDRERNIVERAGGLLPAIRGVGGCQRALAEHPVTASRGSLTSSIRAVDRARSASTTCRLETSRRAIGSASASQAADLRCRSLTTVSSTSWDGRGRRDSMRRSMSRLRALCSRFADDLPAPQPMEGYPSIWRCTSRRLRATRLTVPFSDPFSDPFPELKTA